MVLAGAGIGIATSLAGCLGTIPGLSQSGALEGEHEFGDVAVEIKQLGHHGRWWEEEVEPHPGRIELFAQEGRALEFFPEREYDENPELQQFITDTAFDSQRLLFIGTYGVSYGYDQILLQSLSLDGVTLVGSAAAYADPIADDAMDLYPIVLVRVTFDGDPAERAELTVTSGSGQTIGGGEERTFEARTE